MPNLEAVYTLIDTCVRMTASLRALTLHPGLTPIPPANAEYDELVNLFTLTQAALDAWLATARPPRPPRDRRMLVRRQGSERRQTPEDRRQRSEAGGEPPASESVV